MRVCSIVGLVRYSTNQELKNPAAGDRSWSEGDSGLDKVGGRMYVSETRC